MEDGLINYRRVANEFYEQYENRLRTALAEGCSLEDYMDDQHDDLESNLTYTIMESIDINMLTSILEDRLR